MKFSVTMKDPDVLSDAIEEAVRVEVEALGLPGDEAEMLRACRAEKVREQCRQWFDHGEYLRVQIDTAANTIAVVSR